MTPATFKGFTGLMATVDYSLGWQQLRGHILFHKWEAESTFDTSKPVLTDSPSPPKPISPPNSHQLGPSIQKPRLMATISFKQSWD